MNDNSRMRILCLLDGDEQVVYGKISYYRSPTTGDTIAFITDEKYPDNPFRLIIDSVLEVSSAIET